MTSNSTPESLPPLERLRGMQDVGPALFRRRQAVLRRILHILERHGYEVIETPILEPTELFLRKAGPERIAQLYAFPFRNRDIALRPEHTASVLRYYVDARQNDPLRSVSLMPGRYSGTSVPKRVARASSLRWGANSSGHPARVVTLK